MRWYFRADLLSPRVVRVQFFPGGDPPGEASFFFRHRTAPLPWPALNRQGKQIVYTSEHFELRLLDNGDAPNRNSFEVRWRFGARGGVWRPGDLDEQNLGAGFSALDNCNRDLIASGVHPFDPLRGHDAYRCNTDDGHVAVAQELRQHLGRFPTPEERNAEMAHLVANTPSPALGSFSDTTRQACENVRHYPPGFLTRGGLAVIRDVSPIWDSAAQWPRERSAEHLDLTFVALGDDYMGALAEIARLAGPVARPPDWALGVWFSCYRRMGEEDFRQVVENFAANSLPLDAVVIDCDWHLHGWHGYDWNRELFPHPAQFFEWLHARGIHAVLNDHPGYLPLTDSHFAEFRQQSGNTAEPLTVDNAPHPLHAECIPINLADRRQADAYFGLCHRPVTELGCDLWWIDGATPHWDGSPGTAWLNELFVDFARRMNDPSPIAFSRALGLGCHRTTIAFSGDAWVQWEVLGQEIESTIRGANALIAWPSHDIGGFYTHEHAGNKPPDDLFVRWTQFGALSPIMRYHSDHGVREPWNFSPQTLALCREALQLRRRLQPLFQRLADEAHATGIAPWRPMYFHYPHHEDAYHCWRQAMIGDELLYAPVARQDGEVTIWFPPGPWQQTQTQAIIEGPCRQTRRAPIEEIPLYRRA